ncbi:YcaO-related McrA-glycine thioamidation protein [Kineosporia mesophila]|uniref:YcaO-related McrA-glycine thioamidation protein n=1 Tax=Kineosporia mesophila TaxID=566012 RepID=A0ABP6ZMV1_9ACTN
MVSGLALRSRSLDEVEALADALLERTGISRVSDVTGLDVLGIPVYQSVRPRAAAGLNTVTSGKGVTAQGARVGAKMEAIERFHCEPAGRTALPVPLSVQRNEMLTLDPRRLIPRRTNTWTPQTPLSWWPMRCLRSDAEVAVPALAVFTPFPGEAGLMQSNTIGLAAGNDPVDATVQALYEVIEHDCTAFGEKLRLGYRIRPETVPGPARELIERFERASIRVTVHAYTGGLPVPAFFVTTEDTHARDGMLFNGGAGCHLNPEIALLRALTEAAQSRLAVIAGAREDLDEQAYRRHSSYDELRDYLHEWSAGRPERSFDAIPDRSSGDNAKDLALLLDILAENGLGLVLRTELAPAGLPFTVVKVIVPGSEFAHVDKLRIGARLVAARDHGGSDWITS